MLYWMRSEHSVCYITNRLLLQPASAATSDTTKSKSTSTSEGAYICMEFKLVWY